MSKKSGAIALLIEDCQGQSLPAHYLGYFKCFNQGYYYEAHDVLEELWLSQRHQPNDLFFKGLIQLAGAFVHLQKNRLQPAAALFRLARANLERYPEVHEHLRVADVLRMIAHWLGALERLEFKVNPLTAEPRPTLAVPATVPAS